MWTSLTDPHVFVLPGEPMPPPQTVGGLLTDLGLEDAGRVELEAGIRTWLIGNEPSKWLHANLEAEGFGHLLTDRTA